MIGGCLSNTKNSLIFVTGVVWCPMMRRIVRNDSRIEVRNRWEYRGIVHGSGQHRTTQGSHPLQQFQEWVTALEVQKLIAPWSNQLS